MPIKVNCEECNADLVRYPGSLKRAKYGSFCDRDCLGLFRSRKLTGEYAANYKSGFNRDREYIQVEAKWHPGGNYKGYVHLHRLLAEAMIGRFLTEKEVVHHIDHDPRNNHWSNLEITTQSKHARQHMKDRKKNKDGTLARA
jgi:hypothetical protein